MSPSRLAVATTLVIAVLLSLTAREPALGEPRGFDRQAAACSTGLISPPAYVGKITSIVHTSVYLDLTYIGSAPHSIYKGQYLCTNSSGQVQFTLTVTKVTTCTTYPYSKLRVYPPLPPPSVIINFLAGKSWCKTAKGSGWYSAGGKSKLYTTDPVFGASVTSRQALLKNVYGFFEVTTPVQKEPVIFGPLQQLVILATGTVRPPTAVKLTPLDNAAIATLAPLPTPDYTRPSAGSSKVLARVFSRGIVRVGFVAGKASLPTQSFVRRYFALLAKRWQLKLSFASTDSPGALSSGKVDLLVAQVRKPGPISVSTLPFLTDDQGGAWNMEMLPEDDLVAGVSGYLVATLDSADYANQYRAAFAVQPTYERFRPILFP